MVLMAQLPFSKKEVKDGSGPEISASSIKMVKFNDYPFISLYIWTEYSVSVILIFITLNLRLS